MKKTDLILHPIRLQILSVLSNNHFSTKEIAEKLYNIPVSTIYRQIRILADNSLIEVVAERFVKGTAEKIYSVCQTPHLSAEDMQHISNDQHFQYFLQYILSILDGFQRYLNQSDQPDLIKDYVGYSETFFYLNEDEIKQFGTAFNQAVQPIANNGPGKGRHLHKFAIIIHPENKEQVQD